METLRPIKYEQIRDLLNGLAERFDWDKIMEGDYVIGLKQVNLIITLSFVVVIPPLPSLYTTIILCGDTAKDMCISISIGKASWKLNILEKLSYKLCSPSNLACGFLGN